MAGRVQAYLDRLQQARQEAFEGRPKRPAPDAAEEANKRQKTEVMPDSCTMAQMYTLTSDTGLRGFDVQQIAPNMAANYLVPLFKFVDQNKLLDAVATVRARWAHLSAVKPPVEPLDDDEEYSPEETEKVYNEIEKAPPPAAPIVAAGPYIVPQPPPMSRTECLEYGKMLVMRVFDVINHLPEPDKNRTQGFYRVAASTFDKESWVTVIARLATRGHAGLPIDPQIKQELEVDAGISDFVRETLFRYTLEDWRKRLDSAVNWLTEEWYNDVVSSETSGTAQKFYETWVLRVFDGILPYLDAKDKILIRFLSEIPAINADILERVKRLARDPERVSLAVNALHYLALYRPPVRELCIDALQDLYLNYQDAKAAASKPLQKWRPELLRTGVKMEEQKVTPVTA